MNTRLQLSYYHNTTPMKNHTFHTSTIKISVISIILIILFPTSSLAIPAFARKYQISCQVCHAPALPRLKAFGEEFAAKGFRMTDYESPRYFIQTGDDKLSLFRELPVAIRLDGHVMYNHDTKGKADFTSPYVIKLLSGGELSDKISYYFYFLMNEGGSIVGIEDAFLMFSDVFNTGINFYIGQFQASDPMFKSELRYTLEPYRVYGTTPGTSSANLKYERGIMLEKSFSTGTTLQLEILNGCGIEEKEFDTDKHKNYLFRFSQALGEKLTLGGFYYGGKEDKNIPFGFTNNLKMFGPDLKLNFDDKFIVNMQYIFRRDSRIYDDVYSDVLDNVKTDGFIGEVIFSPKGDQSKWYLTGLFNYTNSNIMSLDYASGTLHAGYLVRRNLRLVTEYTYQFEGPGFGRLSAGFVSAF
ncbi:MAG: hypothetical protein U0X39_12295 [Bacteroidales bacterium]